MTDLQYHQYGVTNPAVSTPFWRVDARHQNGEYRPMSNPTELKETVLAAVQRLKKERGWSYAEIGQRMSTTPQQAERIVKGQRGLTDVWMEKLAQAFEVEPKDLLGDAHTSLKVVNNPIPVMDKVRDLPVYGTALGARLDFMTETSGGIAVEQTELHMAQAMDYIVRPVLLVSRRDVYAVYVSGDSMSPRFDAGRAVLVDPRKPPRIGDDVIVFLKQPNGDDGEVLTSALIKTLVRRSTSYYELEQYNPRATFRVDSQAVHAVHRIIPWDEAMGL